MIRHGTFSCKGKSLCKYSRKRLRDHDCRHRLFIASQPSLSLQTIPLSCVCPVASFAHSPCHSERSRWKNSWNTRRGITSGFYCTEKVRLICHFRVFRCWAHTSFASPGWRISYLISLCGTQVPRRASWWRRGHLGRVRYVVHALLLLGTWIRHLY
jgi:hypothetical protein